MEGCTEAAGEMQGSQEGKRKQKKNTLDHTGLLMEGMW